MGLTAFLPTGAPQLLPFIGSPGVGTVGHALVWSQDPQGFTLAPIAVGPDNFSGVLPIAKGGTGSITGSITGTGALTFTAGGSNQNITLSPSGTGEVIFSTTALINPPPGPRNTGLVLQYPSNTSNVDQGFILRKSTSSGLGFFSFLNGSAEGNGFEGVLETQSSGNVPSFWVFSRVPLGGTVSERGVFHFSGRSISGGSGYPANTPLFTVASGTTIRHTFSSNGNFAATGQLSTSSTQASTSTTTGSCVVSGGLGVGGAIYNGGGLVSSGTKINFANLPTSDTALAVGDLWRDGNTVKVKV